MNIQAYIELCDLVHSLLEVGISYYDASNEAVYQLGNPARDPRGECHRVDENVVIRNDDNLCHLIGTIHGQERLVVGPYWCDEVADDRSIPYISRGKIDKVIDLIGRRKKQQGYAIFTKRLLNKDIDESPSISHLIEKRYKMEEELLHMVSKGQFKAICEKFKDYRSLYTLDDRIPDDRIRCLKNYLIIDNTSLRTAIREKGVHPIYIHNLSERFAFEIERITSLDEYYSLLLTMVEAYCELVKGYSTQSYSRTVKKAIEHIMENTNKKLSTKDIADALHICPSYLSRQFKSETGTSLVYYIHEIKVNEAKYYLNQGMHNITEIAYLLGYSDSNYFTRVFKRVTGETPHEYLRKPK